MLILKFFGRFKHDLDPGMVFGDLFCFCLGDLYAAIPFICVEFSVFTYPAESCAHMAEMKRRLWEGLKAAVPTAKLNGPELDDPASAPHVLNVSLQPVRSQTMLFALEGEGVYVSAGSACAAHKQKVSGVLTAMGLSTAEADCSLRFSLCPSVTGEEIDYTIATVKKHYDMLKAFVRR